MTTDDEKFFAWLDGELSGEEAAAIEAKVDADPRLSQLAHEHRALTSRLRSAFGTVADAPVPERLAAGVQTPAGQVVHFAAHRQPLAGRPWASLPQWASMAATLVLGLVLGLIVREPSGGPVDIHGGGIYAAAALDQALDSQLASAPADSDVRVGLTFRDQGGAICRTFTDPQASGLACRDGDRWRVSGLFAPPEGQTSEYRMAAGTDPNLAALISSTIVGEPFDAAEERTAKQRGWQ